MKQIKNKTGSIIPIIIVALIVVSIIAGFLDTYFYGEFLSTKGISRWTLKLVNPKYILEYLSSLLGLTLTVLSLSPWLFILGVLYWPDLNKNQ